MKCSRAKFSNVPARWVLRLGVLMLGWTVAFGQTPRSQVVPAAGLHAAAARLREEGADCILIVRLVDRASYDRQVRATPDAFVPVTTGYNTYGWYGYYDVAFMKDGYYDVAFMNMGVNYGGLRDYLVLDSSLFDLNTGQRLWSVMTQTVLKEGADRLVVADKLTEGVAAQLLKDGMIH